MFFVVFPRVFKREARCNLRLNNEGNDLIFSISLFVHSELIASKTEEAVCVK